MSAATLADPAELDAMTDEAPSSGFHAVFDDAKQRDAFQRFLQVVFRVYPEAKFHRLIQKVCARHDTDEEIYREVQRRLPEIKPFLSGLTFALPALLQQKAQMIRQTRELLDGRREFKGYLGIGSAGRYVGSLRRHVRISGPVFLLNDTAPGNGLGDILERGQLSKVGSFIPLNEYAPIREDEIADGSLDLVTIYTGLHHCTQERLDAFVHSLGRVLRPGGTLILREHDVRTPAMATFVSLVHTVRNLGLNVPWLTEVAEHRCFRSADEWGSLLGRHGFQDSGRRLYQFMDPSDNTLMRFTRK